MNSNLVNRPTDEELEDEYDIYWLYIKGGENGLKELRDIFDKVEDEDGYAQVSKILKAVGLEPERGDDDAWWNVGLEEDPNTGHIGISLYEHLKRPFSLDSIIRVIRTLRNAHDVNLEIEWKLISNGFIEPKDDDLVLTCPICGNNSAKLVMNPAMDDWAEVIAFDDRLRFCQKNEYPRVGDVKEVWVDFPVYCEKGETFSATIGDDGTFITVRFLKIVKHKKYSAKISVKILSVCSRQSFVKSVPEEKQLRLKKEQTYDYLAPKGERLDIEHVSDNIVKFSNHFGGDIFFEDYIFTDSNDIDHLIQSCYSDFDRKEACFGDKVLGYHKYCPLTII